MEIERIVVPLPRGYIGGQRRFCIIGGDILEFDACRAAIRHHETEDYPPLAIGSHIIIIDPRSPHSGAGEIGQRNPDGLRAVEIHPHDDTAHKLPVSPGGISADINHERTHGIFACGKV